MITLSEFIAVISLCLTSFGLGYKLGKDKVFNESDKNSNSRPGSAN